MLILCAALNAQAQAQEIVIGRTLPLSGPISVYGQAKMQGADLMLDQQNAKGGINGHKLKVITLDDQYDPTQAVANARVLDAQHGALLMLNSLGVPAVAHLMPVLEELKLPGIGFSSGVPAVRDPGRRYVFPMRAGYQEEAEFTVRQLTSSNIGRVALVEQQDPFGKAVADAYRAALQKYSLTLITTVGIKRDQPDSKSAVAQLIAAAPQAILLAVNTVPAAAVLKDYRKAGGGVRAFVYAMSVTDATQLAKIAMEESRGVAFSQVVPLPTGKSKRILREYVALADAKDIAPSFYGLEGYIEAKIAVEALKKAGKTPTRESIVQALASFERLDLGDFEVSYGKESRKGSRFVEMVIIGPEGRLMN